MFSKLLTISVTYTHPHPEEKDLIERAADKRSLSVASYIRTSVLNSSKEDLKLDASDNKSD
jgi:hypothetical protein